MAWVKRTYRYRLPPCPPYDVEGTESWLCDLAQEGWFLCENGFFAGFACFVTGEPKAVRYRLEAAPRQAGIFDDNGGDPDYDTRELHQELGWTYVTRRGQFYIYRNDQPGERELNTDPAVQAIAIKEVEKRQRSSISLLLIWLVLRPLLDLRGALLLTSISIGTPLFLLLVLLVGWTLVRAVAQVVHLGRLRKKLKGGESLDHGKDWRSGARRYYTSRALWVALLAVAICVGVKLWSDDAMNVGKLPLDTCDPPFATVADWFPGAKYEPWEFMSGTNYVKEWSDPLAPVNIDWAEHADLTLPDGAKPHGGYYVTYHRCASEWVAKELCREYVRKTLVSSSSGLRNLGYLYGILPPEPEETYDLPPGLEADYAVAFPARQGVYFPTLIFRKGNVVVRAFSYSFGDLTPEGWMTALVASIE